MNPSKITDMASAFYESSVLFTASDLGIFSTLAEKQSADCATMAEACGLDLRGARLLLDACVALELLTKQGETYANSAEAAMFLVPDSPADLSQAIRYNRDVYSAWGKLPDLIRTGAPVEPPELHLGGDPDRTRTFVLSMHGRALGIGQAVIPMVDLSGRQRLLDVGGGPGTYSVLLAKAYPDLTSKIIDVPEVVAVAKDLIAQQGMSERVTTLPGDYHTLDFPGGCDAINFFGVLHQEAPDAIQTLFHKAYEALVPGGVIHVLDMMTDATHTEPKFSSLFAVNMALTTAHGWVFSDVELAGWLREAGFQNFACRTLPPPMPHWLASAHKST